MFGKPAIIAEASQKVSRKFPNTTSGGSLASDYWDIIPQDAGQDESSRQSKKRVLSYAQVASPFHFISFSYSLAKFIVLVIVLTAFDQIFLCNTYMLKYNSGCNGRYIDILKTC